MTGGIATARGIVKNFAGGECPALDGVDITIGAGLMTGLVGPDGAGKTTLIRILAGLVEPDTGEALVAGLPAVTADRALIGYMPQRFGLYEDLTVGENLRLYAELRGLPETEQAGRFARLLEFTGLGPFTARLAGRLSGGMKQKLGLACALVRTPHLLLLDEPGVGVDPVSRRELWAMVHQLTSEGIGVLWSTAYLDEAERCDNVTLLNQGRCLYAGEPDGLLEQVEGRVLRALVPEAGRRATLRRALDAPAVMDGTIQGEAIRLLLREGGSLPAPEALALPPDSTLEPVRPRFEDAFINLLGGGPPGTSTLAAQYRAIPPGDAPAIEAHGLTRRFGDFTAADNITFTVERGQIFGLLGPNGAGKSTTFKMLCGLLTPSSGDGAVAGHDLRRTRADARQSLGYMAQKFSLYGDLSVMQNLEFFAGAYGLGGRAARQAIGNAIEAFHLDRYLRRNAGTMPLGYKQRLALACAVLHEPPVLFLDEPTSGVDPIVRREFWTHINGLVEKGVTVLVTTHFMDEAEYCDRATLIYQARQIATGTPDELKTMAGSEALNGGAGKAGENEGEMTMEDAFVALIAASEHRANGGEGRQAA